MTIEIPKIPNRSNSSVKIVGLRGEVEGEALKSALKCLIRIASSDAKLHVGDEMMTAQQALEMGLVTHVCQPDELEKTVELKATEIGELAPLAIARAIESVERGIDLTFDEAMELETDLFVACFETEDAREGPRAFLEKRRPAFRGR